MGVQVPCRLHAEISQEGLFAQIGRHLGSVFHKPTKLRNFLGHKFWGEQLQLKLASS